MQGMAGEAVVIHLKPVITQQMHRDSARLKGKNADNKNSIKGFEESSEKK